MRNWRRLLIWVFTFVFGLYYIVEFMLPEEIGGALDRSGVGAATAVYSGGWQVYYSALAGPMKADGTPDEKLQQYRITRLSLDEPDRREVVLSPSMFRREDYNGAKSPSILLEDGRWKMWYIGLDFADRKPTVLYTESADGKAWDRPASILPDPLGLMTRQGELAEALRERIAAIRSDASLNQDEREERVRQENDRYSDLIKRLLQHWLSKGIESVAVRHDDGGYRMWFVGLGGGKTSLGAATSADGKDWNIAPDPLPLDREFRKITSVTAMRTDAGWEVLFAADGGLYRWSDGVTEPVTLPVKRVASADAARGDGRTLLLVSYFQNGGRQALAAYTRDGGAWTPMGEAVKPGPGGFTVMPVRLPTVAGWLQIVSAFAVGIGLIGLLRIHLARLFKLRQGWHDSGLLILSMAAICAAVIMYRLLPEAGTPGVDPGYRDFVEKAHEWLWLDINVPLGATMFSLLAAFLVSAAYRAFRIRGRDATILAISATLVMLAQVPVGDLLTSWMPPAWQEAFGMSAIRQWYLNLANSAVQRGISFGVFVGAIAMALRIWLSLDRIGTER